MCCCVEKALTDALVLTLPLVGERSIAWVTIAANETLEDLPLMDGRARTPLPPWTDRDDEEDDILIIFLML